MLGSHGTWPGVNGQCSGYLVSHDGFHLWLDAGTGTFARVQEHIAVADIGAMLITHGHADHFLDVIPHFYARHYGQMGSTGPAVLLAGGVHGVGEHARLRVRTRRDVGGLRPRRAGARPDRSRWARSGSRRTR